MGAKSSVFHGTKTKTSGGLTKDKLMKNKNGRIVSKARSAAAKKRFASSPLKAWNQAIKAARKQLKITGFCPVNGKTAQGQSQVIAIVISRGNSWGRFARTQPKLVYIQ